jgi:hypothetical protein
MESVSLVHEKSSKPIAKLTQPNVIKRIEQLQMLMAVLLNLIALMVSPCVLLCYCFLTGKHRVQGYDECFDEWWIVPIAVALLFLCGASFVATFMLQFSFLFGQGAPITLRGAWETLRSDGTVAHRFFNLLAALVALFVDNGLYLYVFHLLDLLLRSPIAYHRFPLLSELLRRVRGEVHDASFLFHAQAVIFFQKKDAENECATLMQCFVTTFYKVRCLLAALSRRADLLCCTTGVASGWWHW